MRACTKCGELKPLDAFPPVRRGEPELQTWCRDCFAEANARNYQKNHDREKARLLRQVAVRRAEVRQKIIEYLRDHPCVDCGETDIVVLEFDHVGEKIANISTYANAGRTWERALAVIQKCEVRCSNCHRRKTLERSSYQRESQTTHPAESRRRPVQLLIESAIGLRVCRPCQRPKRLSGCRFRSLTRQTRHWICHLCRLAR